MVIGDMGSAGEQVLAAIKVLLYVGPVAVYVLWLGLVNSQATPKLVKIRDDFVIMTVAFFPLVVAPVVSLAHAGYRWASVAAAVLMLAVFLRLLPARASGWVIYNLSPHRARILAERTLHALGWSYHWDGWSAVVAENGLSVEISFVGPLRNVTFHLHTVGALARTAEVEAFRAELALRLRREGGLPSLAGCCLLAGGVALLIVPLWMLSHHSAAIAEVVTRILLS
ncbi:MAG: hypothetical protein V2A79_11105 [Planctomycetota bacterium]